jgi:hypothetical protein
MDWCSAMAMDNVRRNTSHRGQGNDLGSNRGKRKVRKNANDVQNWGREGP